MRHKHKIGKLAGFHSAAWQDFIRQLGDYEHKLFSKNLFILTLYDSIAWYIKFRKTNTDITESRRFRSETSQQATAEVL